MRLFVNIKPFKFSFMFLQLPSPLAAQETRQLELHAETPVFSLANHINFIEDQGGCVDIVEAMKAFHDGAYSNIEGGIVDFGYSGSTYWLHSRLHNADEKYQTWVYDLDHVRMAEFEVYVVRAGQVDILAKVKGKDSLDARAIKHRLLLANIEIEPQETVDLFVKFSSYGNSKINPKLSQYEDFVEQDSMATMLHSLLLGALLLLAIYNLMMAVLLKSKPHFWYVFFVSAGMLHMAQQSGLAFVYIWPNYGAFNSIAADMFGFLTLVFVLIFSRSFLQLNLVDKKLNLISLGLIITCMGFIVLTLVDRPPYIGKIGFLMATLVALFNLVGSIRAYNRGFRSARFVILGWVGVVFAGIIVIFSTNNFLPFAVDTNVLFEISLLLESLLFSASLLDYVTEMRVSVNKAQKKLIQSLEAETQANFRAFVEAEQKNQALLESAAKGRALSAINHDIRQPIHALKLYLIALRGNKDLAKIAKGMGNMWHTILNLEKLLASVMDSSEPESDGEVIVKERFCVNNLIASSQLIFSTQADEKGLRVRAVPSSLELYTDLGVMMRIVNNIVSNAVKYTDSGKILIGCRRRGDKAALQVYDNGRGIPDQQLASIFKTHYRLNDQDQNKESRGLGLSIVKRLADRIGAEVKVQSKQGVGTLFEIELPLCIEDVNHVKTAALKGIKCVIIDDNLITLDELCSQLEGFGAETIKGTSWASCLQDLPSKEWRPDLIISDLHLADTMTGVDQANLIYEHYAIRLPTIIVTFDRLAKTRKQVAKLAGAQMLYKPLDSFTLLNKIKEMMNDTF